MKNNTKILIAFSVVILLIFIQGTITFFLQNQLYDQTLLVKDVEVPLEIITDHIRGYESSLTEETYATAIHLSMDDYADTKHHIEMHSDLTIEIETLLNKEAPTLIERSTRSQKDKDLTFKYLHKTIELHNNLKEIELQVFEAAKAHDNDSAYSLLMNGEYHKYKDQISETLDRWEKLERDITHQVTYEILKKSERIIFLNMGTAIGLILIICITVIIIMSFLKEIKKKKK